MPEVIVKIIINEVEYLANSFATVGYNGEDKVIYRFGLNKSYNEMIALFHDDMEWSIKINDEYIDCSQSNIVDSLLDTRDGNVIITMRPETDLEEAYELLYGGDGR